MDKRKVVIVILSLLLGVGVMFSLIYGFYLSSDNMNKAELELLSSENIESIVETMAIDNTEVTIETGIDKLEEVIVTEPVKLEEDIRMFLFLGIDRTEKRDQFSSIYRSDSIAMLRMDMNSNWAKVLSIPRDTYAYLPVKNFYDKINHSYAYGSLNGRGEASVLEAVNNFVGDETTRKYFALEMDPIPEIVESFGGVEVDVEIDIKTHGADIDKGLQVLTGKDAYDYVHWRYSGDGDIGRIKRQQKFVNAAINQVSDKYETQEMTKLLLENSEYFNTNIHVSEIEEIIRTMSRVDQIEYYMIEGIPKKINKIWYWVPDESCNKETIEAFFTNPDSMEEKNNE